MNQTGQKSQKSLNSEHLSIKSESREKAEPASKPQTA